MSAMRFLSDKDLEWMASYEQGDTILFQSSNEKRMYFFDNDIICVMYV